MKDCSKNLIGVLGGSFDPPHIGHIELAKTVLKERPEISEVWMMVAKQNPLKTRKSTDFQDRFEMLKLACSGIRGVVPCDLEASYPEYTTKDILQHLSSDFPGLQFSLIIGMDNFMTFHKWYAYKEICEKWPLYVLTRPGFGGAPIDIPVGAFIQSADIPVSSTQIRSDPWVYQDFLSPQVTKYIYEHHLYGTV